MASVAAEFRRIALRVCDALDAAEASTAATDASPAGSYPALLGGLDERGLEDALAVGAALRSETDMLLAAGAGVVAKLSERELGYTGLASRKGHRSPVSLIQSITGSPRTEAARQVRLGEAMGEADAARRLNETGNVGEANDVDDSPDGPALPPEPAPPSMPPVPPVVLPWFEPVTRAVQEHALTPDGAAAIIRGMGEPSDRCGTETMRAGVIDLLAQVTELTADRAGTVLAGTVNADQLAKLARQARDRIDPAGCRNGSRNTTRRAVGG